MTRGNQRLASLVFVGKYIHWLSSSSDLAREKNLKNQKNKGQSASETDANKGLSLQERQARDAAK